MREHMGLYRGKRPDNGEWVEGNLLLDGYDYDTAIWETGTKLVTKVDPTTIGECTGLKDLGGTVLFEHDVVTAKFKSNGARFNFKIVFRDGTFLFDNGLAAVPFDKIRSVVKKGNFFDNPDLLEGGEA